MNHSHTCIGGLTLKTAPSLGIAQSSAKVGGGASSFSSASFSLLGNDHKAGDCFLLPGIMQLRYKRKGANRIYLWKIGLSVAARHNETQLHSSKTAALAS